MHCLNILSTSVLCLLHLTIFSKEFRTKADDEELAAAALAAATLEEKKPEEKKEEKKPVVAAPVVKEARASLLVCPFYGCISLIINIYIHIFFCLSFRFLPLSLFLSFVRVFLLSPLDHVTQYLTSFLSAPTM